MAKFVQPVRDPWFESLQDHAIGAFDLPIHPGVRFSSPIHADMVIIVEIKKLFASELRAVVGDDGVYDPEAMDNISKEEHRLLRFNLRNWPSLNPLLEFVDGEQQVGEAPGALSGAARPGLDPRP
jgi:hypothetical protein